MTVSDLFMSLDNAVQSVKLYSDGELVWDGSFDEPYVSDSSAWVILDELYAIPGRYHNSRVSHFRVYKDVGGTEAIDVTIKE
jgi:hypothetical protein